jgi:hypothetical protein
MSTELHPTVLRLLLAFAALGCGAGAVVVAAMLAVNVLG